MPDSNKKVTPVKPKQTRFKPTERAAKRGRHYNLPPEYHHRLADMVKKNKMSNVEDALKLCIDAYYDIVEGRPVLEGGREEAALKFLPMFEPSKASWLRDVAMERNVPLHWVIAGCVNLCLERSEVYAFIIDPGWKDDEVVADSYVCDNCGIKFDPHNLGQLYCCNLCGKDGKNHNESCTTHTSIATHTIDDFDPNYGEIAPDKQLVENVLFEDVKGSIPVDVLMPPLDLPVTEEG